MCKDLRKYSDLVQNLFEATYTGRGSEVPTPKRGKRIKNSPVRRASASQIAALNKDPDALRRANAEIIQKGSNPIGPNIDTTKSNKSKQLAAAWAEKEANKENRSYEQILDNKYKNASSWMLYNVLLGKFGERPKQELIKQLRVYHDKIMNEIKNLKDNVDPSRIQEVVQEIVEEELPYPKLRPFMFYSIGFKNFPKEEMVSVLQSKVQRLESSKEYSDSKFYSFLLDLWSKEGNPTGGDFIKWIHDDRTRYKAVGLFGDKEYNELQKNVQQTKPHESEIGITKQMRDELKQVEKEFLDGSISEQEAIEYLKEIGFTDEQINAVFE